ncbi:uncharacterized protein K460DRAFT_362240 [Cucurbitaria berberidis CBS 394.84]|uniref:G-patch domain-containing protein n=1 Tax=Cucurbitaria berberidis CBS 394.84 TaxID=1168544 RepID=A0A9P4LE58_9PLEO|nr:uncharacterized protein K460DRAFT_362240 [Cucurbitaria berberidis CBS 394.84]KAF1851498.1 hypothetical protein K460DRAFT_362240 [Cucurbitaria berberidis CBS 394.84]
MNADAYLRKQGWKGSGHSLDSTGRGIRKPLLISHKQDQLGLGKKKAAYTTDDQWWMRAFDESLQSIGTGKESTLDQIRTKGINRGGLYGFFVKGEAIKGTIEDESATTTDTSIPPSGASTPPTSVSDTEAPARTRNMSVKENKRKRAGTDVSGSSKKTKTGSTQPKHKKEKEALDKKDQAAVAAKLAKLKPSEKAEYETRAAAKNQTLQQYILRRIQKKAEKRETKYVEPADPALFFTDLEGDANLINLAQSTTPITYTPLPNRIGSPDSTKMHSQDFDSLPKPVSKAQRGEARHDVKSTTEESKIEQGDGSDDENQTANIAYTPLADGSCPLDPTIWEGHKAKSLPKPVRNARQRWIAQQRLVKKLKRVEGGERKELIGLTKAEKQLIKEGSLDNQGLDLKQFDLAQWGIAGSKAKLTVMEEKKKKAMKKAIKRELKEGMNNGTKKGMQKGTKNAMKKELKEELKERMKKDRGQKDTN